MSQIQQSTRDALLAPVIASGPVAIRETIAELTAARDDYQYKAEVLDAKAQYAPSSPQRARVLARVQEHLDTTVRLQSAIDVLEGLLLPVPLD